MSALTYRQWPGAPPDGDVLAHAYVDLVTLLAVAAAMAAGFVPVATVLAVAFVMRSFPRPAV